MDAHAKPKGVIDDDQRLLVRPNRTLTLRGMTLLFAGLTFIVFAIGIGFALAGAWPVLPFAGLEMILVGAVLYRLFRHADDCDRICIDRDHVTVIRRRGRNEWRDKFQRHWTKVNLEHQASWYPSRLKVGSHGKFVIIADDVNEDERKTLSLKLNNILRKAG